MITEGALRACCAAPSWVRAVALGWPYASVEAARAAALRAARELPWDEVLVALAAHPRIGSPSGGSGREAAWSRVEQAGVTPEQALIDANAAYERRFGHVFLIFATGKSATDVLAAAQARLGNDEATERDVVREELAQIAALRLEKLMANTSPLSTHVLDNARGEPAAGVPVRLERADVGGWVPLAHGSTGADGRLRDWVPAAGWGAGVYRLVFDTAAYHGPDAFFPEVTVAFRVTEPERHYHVPLLLSPFGYATYRGS